jgi:hypothetical protein
MNKIPTARLWNQLKAYEGFLFSNALLSPCVEVCLLCLLSVSDIEKIPGVPGTTQ